MISNRTNLVFFSVVFLFAVCLILLLPKGEDYRQYLDNFSIANTKSIVLNIMSEILSALGLSPWFQIIIVSMFSLMFALNSAILLDKIFQINRSYFFVILTIPNFGNDWLSHVRSNLGQMIVVFVVCALIYHKKYLWILLTAAVATLIHIATIIPLLATVTFYRIIRQLFFIISFVTLTLCPFVFYYSEDILAQLLHLTQNPLLNFYFNNRLVPNLSILAVIEKIVLSAVIFLQAIRFNSVNFKIFAALYFVGVLLFCSFSFDPNMAGRISKPFNFFGYVCLLVIFSRFRPRISGVIFLQVFLGLKLLSSIRYLL